MSAVIWMSSLLGQALDPPAERLDDGLGLFGDQGVARVRNDHHGDARSEFVLHLVALGFRLERIVGGLQVEERRSAARPPFVLLDSRCRRTLGVADLGMPSLQPDRRIVARREEAKP